MMILSCVQELSQFLPNAFAVTPAAPLEICPELCPSEMDGDLTINCFRLAKPLRQNPMAVADKALEFLRDHPDVAHAEKVKAFVNFTMNAAPLFHQTAQRVNALLDMAKLPEDQCRRELIEYSAPNTNKPLHLGHLRNNCLGMALVSLLRRVGHDVVAVNLVNDRGVHICKSMLAYQRFGDGVTPETAGKKGDHLVGDFYVKYDAELRKQLKELRDAKPELASESDDALFTQTEIGAATQDMLIKWENNDPDVRALWKTMNGWVLDGFNQTYERMGVKFDKVYFESDTYSLGKDIALDGLEKGVFQRREDGAVFADLSAFKLNQKILLRSDGTSVYITQDIGTTLKKFEEFQPEGMVWVVGDEQIHHFNVLFAILKQLGYKWADNLNHLAYGMVNLPSGKMKSREGTVVDADNLFDEMFDLAKQATLERCGDDIPGDIDERCERIAMGALKFMLLKFNPKSTIMFDPDASVRFEGDTGPYAQYACARINSILRKAEERGYAFEPDQVDWNLLDSKWERDVATRLMLYPEALQQAAERMDSSGVVAYVLNLAKAFNAFYRESPVLNADNDALRQARLALCAAVHVTLLDALNTLTIPVPDAM